MAFKGTGATVGGVVGGVVGSIIPGAGTTAGAAVGGLVGGIYDTFQAQNQAKEQRTAGMFGGPRIRPQPQIAAASPLPNVGVPYLGAPAGAEPAQAGGSGMMKPSPTQGG